MVKFGLENRSFSSPLRGPKVKVVPGSVWQPVCCGRVGNLYSSVGFSFSFCSLLLFLLALHRYRHTLMGVLPTVARCPDSNWRFMKRP